MKTSHILNAVVILVCAAGTAGRPWRVTEARTLSATADLDGDGDSDDIDVTVIVDELGFRNRCVVEVNGRAHEVLVGVAFEDTVSIVDIDKADPLKEVVVMDEGPSDDYLATVLRYAGGSLQRLGTIPAYSGVPICNGDGVVHTAARGRILHTWYFPTTYRVNRDGQLVELSPPLKPMNTKVKLKMPLDLETRDTRKPCGRIRRGERATILETDDINWCHIRSERGLDGWFELDRVLAGGRSAGDVFDGLCFAD